MLTPSQFLARVCHLGWLDPLPIKDLWHIFTLLSSHKSPWEDHGKTHSGFLGSPQFSIARALAAREPAATPMVARGHAAARCGEGACACASLVKIIDVVRNRRRAHNFHHDVDSSYRFAASCRSVSRAKTWRSVPGRAGTQSASGRRRATPSRRQPIRTCVARSVLENADARFSGDGVSALSGDSPDYLLEAVPLNQFER
jgi:hypothetical protein